MKKLLALAGLATALFAAVPMAAQAGGYSDRHVERDGPRGGHYERDVYRSHGDRHGDRDRDRGYHRGHDRGYDRGHDYRHMKHHNFGHWRPSLERARYHHFGRPVAYGHYYRVPARDYRGHTVTLSVNAYTGAILSVGY